jgi:hypothetical protein
MFLSHDIRGLGNDSKNSTLCRLVQVNQLDILLLQNTMGEGRKVKGILQEL